MESYKFNVRKKKPFQLPVLIQFTGSESQGSKKGPHREMRRAVRDGATLGAQLILSDLYISVPVTISVKKLSPETIG